MLTGLLNEQVNQSIINNYEVIINENATNKLKRYYIYCIFIIDKDGTSKVINIKYFSKGCNERCLTHFRTAFICSLFNITPSSTKTKYICESLKAKQVFYITKIENKLEKDAFVRETSLISIKNSDLLNVCKTSTNLSKIDLSDKMIDEVRKDTIQRLFNDEQIVVDLESLTNDYNENLKEIENYYNSNLTEREIEFLIYLKITANTKTVLNSIQKLVILIQMLIWLNDARALSNSGIHEVFEYLNLEIPSSKSVVYHCFSSYVKKLVFSKNYIMRLIDELKKLEIEINKNENFKQLVNEITGKCNELLNESKYKRKIKREYLVDQLYAINKIVEISETNKQFLNPESNYQIYLSIDKIEDQLKHEIYLNGITEIKTSCK